VSDHRINLTLSRSTRLVSGEALDELVDALIADDMATKLSSCHDCGGGRRRD